MCCRQAAWSRWLIDKSAYIDQLVERGQWVGRQRELILLDILSQNEQFVLRWAFTACIGTSHTGGILRIFVQKGSFWMEKWSRWMFFFFFFFYKSQNCFPLITLTSQSSFLDISSNLPGSMAASILHGQTTLSWGVCGKVTQPKEIAAMKKGFSGTPCSWCSHWFFSIFPWNNVLSTSCHL